MSKTKLSEKLNIPKDISQGIPIVTITGVTEIYVENYKRILEYSKNILRLQTRHFLICITGNCLEILYYSGTDMQITGEIKSIYYER